MFEDISERLVVMTHFQVFQIESIKRVVLSEINILSDNKSSSNVFVRLTELAVRVGDH